MAKLLPIHEGNHRGLLDWLQNTLPGLPTAKPDVWAHFLAFTGLTEPNARSAVRYGPDPIVFPQTLDGIDGQFDLDRLRVIKLGLHITGTATVPDPLMLERTLLHEMVHWAWGNARREEPGEQGDAFESAAYGTATRRIVEVAKPADDHELGKLSSRWESRGNPGAVGRDTNGGWSYGLYQLSSRQGRVADFLRALDRPGPGQAYARALREAGGDAEARQGSQRFIQAWKTLAADPGFGQAQHDFIRATHYQPFVTRLTSDGIDIRDRSRALNDVAWSVSVQHGPGSTGIFRNAWTPLAPEARRHDPTFITAIYRERSRVDVYFKSSSAKERAAVLKRFHEEQLAALEMAKQA